jgi:hypothetical protein
MTVNETSGVRVDAADYTPGWQLLYLSDRYKGTAASMMLTYGPSTTFVVGLVGHVLSLLVLLRLSATLPSTTLYLIVGLIIDVPVLYIQSGNTCIKQVCEMDLFSLKKPQTSVILHGVCR